MIKEILNHLHAEHADHAEHLDHAEKKRFKAAINFSLFSAKVIEIKCQISAKLRSRLSYDDF